MTPHPSPRANPSAAASKVLQRPSGASIRECDKAMNSIGREDKVHSARERHAAFAVAQRIARQMNGHQRRRTCRVNRHARSLKPEHVGKTASDDAVRNARCEVSIEQGGIPGLELKIGVVAAADAHVHAGGRTLEPIRRLTSVLERLPADLKQQTLLRIDPHALRVARC